MESEMKPGGRAVGLEHLVGQGATYPLALCIHMLSYAAMSCPLTDDKKSSEIKDAARFFFTDDEINDAMHFLCHGMLPNATLKPPLAR